MRGESSRVVRPHAPSVRRRRVPALILLLTALAGLTQLGGVFGVGAGTGFDTGLYIGALRPALVFAFLFVCPGAALMGLVRLDGVTGLVLSVALSLVLLTLVSEVVVFVGAWSLEAGFWALVAVSAVGSAAQLLGRARQASPAERQG